jgi:hypothetical protein
MDNDTPIALLRLKLKRANERLNALQRQLNRHSESHRVTVATKLDPQSGWHTSYVHHAELPPARFALPAGESLYHGRSLLDHLVWALVKANNETPGKHNEFPILPKPPSARKGEGDGEAFIRVEGANKLAGVHPDAVAVIERLQPYNGGNDPQYFLTVLNVMARDDRHHALHPSLVAMGHPDSLRPRLDIPRGVVLTHWEPLFEWGDTVEPGTKLARFRLSRWGRYPEMGMKGTLPAYIAFGDPPVMLDGLREINRNLSKLLRSLEEFL